jgi:uncharacterized RDD family membrane protein YckC
MEQEIDSLSQSCYFIGHLKREDLKPNARGGLPMNQRAGFFFRAAALMIDIAVILILFPVLARASGDLLARLGVPLSSIDTNAGAVGVIIYDFWVLAVFYLMIEVLTSVTPGKLLLGLRVADEDGQGHSLGRRIARYLGKIGFLLLVPPFGLTESPYLVYPFLAVSAVSFLGCFLIFTPRKQTLYDRLSKTAVFRKAKS